MNDPQRSESSVPGPSRSMVPVPSLSRLVKEDGLWHSRRRPAQHKCTSAGHSGRSNRSPLSSDDHVLIHGSMCHLCGWHQGGRMTLAASQHMLHALPCDPRATMHWAVTTLAKTHSAVTHAAFNTGCEGEKEKDFKGQCVACCGLRDHNDMLESCIVDHHRKTISFSSCLRFLHVPRIIAAEKPCK